MKEKIESVLGAEWKRRLAQALACTSERFNNPLSCRVLAVIELLESVSARDPKLLPDRWNVIKPVSDDDEVQPPNLRDRFARLFGADALVPRLSVAIGMARETIANAFRGRSLRAQSDLVAIIELLEILYGLEASEKNWPPRWRQINNIEERRRSTRRPPEREIPDPLEMKVRVVAVLGCENSSAMVARALGKSPDSLSRIWRSELDSHGRPARVQPALAAVIELLETLRAEEIPIERWPKRWRTAVRKKATQIS
ncbi:MAG: hypothetical protein WC026_05080 [Hyphomicrobium sp.]|uniref:hypothetical protein n=1 Tax=Hyphomicrobium sp. TaxID=82 RepID=UPI0035636173